MRVGIGYDVHRLIAGRKLILGGVEIPSSQGLLGHSDADVLVHSIMDALLGAVGLGDIGRHFPDTDQRYSGISSLVLLKKVGDLVVDAGYQVVNIDSVIMAQTPKLAPYISEMVAQIAQTLGVTREAIGVKATTTEGLGYIGNGEGIAAQTVCLVDKAARE